MYKSKLIKSFILIVLQKMDFILLNSGIFDLLQMKC